MPMIRRSVLPYLAWVIALVATVGSLFFSEVMGLPPCLLCWYQRIAMYPLVLIIGSGIIMRDSRMKYYALPLCLIGAGHLDLSQSALLRNHPRKHYPLHRGYFVYLTANRVARLHHDSADGARGVRQPGLVPAVL